MAAILDFIFSSNLKKLPMSCCFFHWILMKIYKMNTNINSLDYFHRFIQKPLARNHIGKKTSSAVYHLPGRCASTIALISTGKHVEIASSL
jgi:hypothetical protein